MNEKIRELAEHCDFYVGNEHYDKSHEEKQRLFMEKFAELIVRECGVALSPMLRDMISRGRAYDMIKQHFGVEQSQGWICPKCNIDRTKEVCPKGHMAAVTGDCPMTAEAQ